MKKYEVSFASSPTTKKGTPLGSTMANVGIVESKDASLPVETTPSVFLPSSALDVIGRATDVAVSMDVRMTSLRGVSKSFFANNLSSFKQALAVGAKASHLKATERIVPMIEKRC